MENTNADVTKAAGAESSATGATLSGGLGTAFHLVPVEDKAENYPCLHGCDNLCPSYPMFRIARHVTPCPHAAVPNM
jgi:hypothetical protein